MTYIRNTTRGYHCTSTTSDDGSEDGSDSIASSCVLVDEAGGIISTPSGSTISSTENNAEVQSAGSLTPPAYHSPVITPSVARSTDEVPPLVDIEDVLTNEFSNLTFHEKQCGLATVGKFDHCDSTPSSESETDAEIWPKTHAAKTCKNRDTSDSGNPHDGIKPSLADWQALCKAVGVAEHEMPSSINKCKEVRLVHNQPNLLPPSCPHPLLSSNPSSLTSTIPQTDSKVLQHQPLRPVQRPP
jgi:hypothetical protein